MNEQICPERHPKTGERCAHTNVHGGACETAPKGEDKHGAMWWPEGKQRNPPLTAMDVLACLTTGHNRYLFTVYVRRDSMTVQMLTKGYTEAGTETAD